MDIHTAITLIDEWVATLEDEELPEKCREAGNDFFSFLQGRGFDPGVFIRAVVEVTGQRPQNLWRTQDAEALRHYISAYNYEEAELSNEAYRDGKDDDDWLENATIRYFAE